MKSTILGKVSPSFGMDLLLGADVTMSPEKYGISFKNGTWYSEFSTPDNRSQRVQDFWKFCETLDVVVG